MDKTYTYRYIRMCFLLIFGLATVVFLPLFIVSQFYDVLPNDTQIAFCVYIPAGIIFLLSLLQIPQSNRMIQKQEALFNVRFHAANAAPLHKTSLIFLSDDWLIVCGRLAVYRTYINHMSMLPRKGTMGNSYYIQIQTVDNRKIQFPVDSASSCKENYRLG